MLCLDQSIVEVGWGWGVGVGKHLNLYHYLQSRVVAERIFFPNAFKFYLKVYEFVFFFFFFVSNRSDVFWKTLSFCVCSVSNRACLLEAFFFFFFPLLFFAKLLRRRKRGVC